MSSKKDPADIRGELEALRREVAYHARKYYVDDAPEISDYDYDMLYRRLVELEAAHTEIFEPEYPTQRDGGDPIERVDLRERCVCARSDTRRRQRRRGRYSEYTHDLLASYDAAGAA